MLVRKENTHKAWFTAFLLLMFVTGCGDPDHTKIPGLAPPTVISVSPTNVAIGACTNTKVSATFSEAMNPATINA